MRPLAPHALAWLCLEAAPVAAAGDFAGHYGHGYSEPADAPVWDVQARGDGYSVTTLGDGETASAHVADADARARFWERMLWPADTAGAARCLSWGAPMPGTLGDALDTLLAEDTPNTATASTDTPPAAQLGSSLLCEVPATTRARIDWLAGNASDWFYYDPLLGVTEVVRTP